jgi:hypothetical protein
VGPPLEQAWADWLSAHAPAAAAAGIPGSTLRHLIALALWGQSDMATTWDVSAAYHEISTAALPAAPRPAVALQAAGYPAGGTAGWEAAHPAAAAAAQDEI